MNQTKNLIVTEKRNILLLNNEEVGKEVQYVIFQEAGKIESNKPVKNE
jgi:hypothetical protein